jgi:hypothetical protein
LEATLFLINGAGMPKYKFIHEKADIYVFPLTALNMSRVNAGIP